MLTLSRVSLLYSRDIGKDEMILLQVWDKELVGKDDFMYALGYPLKF